MKTKEQLATEAETAQSEIERLDGVIAEHVASEEDNLELLSKLRAKRREWIDRAADIGDAVAFVEDKEREEAKTRLETAKSEALSTARSDAQALLTAAERVDLVLGELEAAHDALRLAALDLSRSMRLAGRSDSGRLANGLGPALRWAAWHSAPEFSGKSQVPRVEAHRRRDLRTSASSLIPNLKD